jgi:hypothetical protein
MRERREDIQEIYRGYDTTSPIYECLTESFIVSIIDLCIHTCVQANLKRVVKTKEFSSRQQ